MKWVPHDTFSSGSRQEVNITWYSEIEEPIKSHEKHHSRVSYILNGGDIKKELEEGRGQLDIVEESDVAYIEHVTECTQTKLLCYQFSLPHLYSFL